MLGQFLSQIMRLLRKGNALVGATINQAHLRVLGLPRDVGMCSASVISVLLMRDEALDGVRDIVSVEFPIGRAAGNTSIRRFWPEIYGSVRLQS
jgi:hypothetical protein